MCSWLSESTRACFWYPVSDPHADAVECFPPRMKMALNSAKEGKVQVTRITPLLAISNLGMFGVKEFSAIIPPGCNAILAAGTVRDQVVWRDGRAEAGEGLHRDGLGGPSRR